MLIRKATENDLAAAGAIYDDARKYMREAGNPYQWNDDYPTARDVSLDIADGSSYVCEDNGEVVAAFHFHVGTEDAYEKIYGGEWEGGPTYGVIHRIAVKYHGRKIADFCFEECAALAHDLRIDTHRDNIPMQKCLLKNGFSQRGKVHLKNGEERLAFQKINAKVGNKE